jgi:biopolymer transport protein ExbD
MGFPIKKRKKNDLPRAQQSSPEEYIPQGPDLPESDNRPTQQIQQTTNYLSRMIEQKKAKLSNERAQIDEMRRKMEEEVKEVEALQFIMSGDPSLSIADLLEIIDDYRKNDADKSATEVLDDMEKSLIKSTINGM